MPPVMFSVVTKYHKGRHSLFLYNSEIFYAFTQDILRSLLFLWKTNCMTTTKRTSSGSGPLWKPTQLQSSSSFR
ncbi:hypothetical protein D8911_11385 [Levilactobacillus brevis]|nr:hypothetical protein D8911_11385 [Levilactobacillus brevis]